MKFMDPVEVLFIWYLFMHDYPNLLTFYLIIDITIVRKLLNVVWLSNTIFFFITSLSYTIFQSSTFHLRMLTQFNKRINAIPYEYSGPFNLPNLPNRDHNTNNNNSLTLDNRHHHKHLQQFLITAADINVVVSLHLSPPSQFTHSGTSSNTQVSFIYSHSISTCSKLLILCVTMYQD